MNEPAELHEAGTAEHPLDWGEPQPGRAEIEAEYGARATRASLAMIAAAIVVEPAITKVLLAALADGTRPHQLQHRVKSPTSLARRLALFETADRRDGAVTDVLRYTVLVDRRSGLVAATRATVAELERAGWSVTGAHHSYVEGSRYKGLHVDLRTATGQPVEVQFHSRPSILVKERTTALYAVARDRSLPPATRAAATAEAIRMSAALDAPPGLSEIGRLGGVPVTARRYGPGPAAVRRMPAGRTDGTGSAGGRRAGRTGTQNEGKRR